MVNVQFGMSRYLLPFFLHLDISEIIIIIIFAVKKMRILQLDFQIYFTIWYLLIITFKLR